MWNNGLISVAKLNGQAKYKAICVSISNALINKFGIYDRLLKHQQEKTTDQTQQDSETNIISV